MHTSLRSFLAPPRFPENDEKMQRAALLHMALLVSAGFVSLSLVAIAVGGNVPLRTLLIVALLLALLMQSGRWLRAGQFRRCELVLTAGFFIIFTVGVASIGTIRAPATSVYVFWVMLMVTLFRLPGLVIGSIASSVAVLCLIIAENLGWLPKPNLSVGVTQWLVFTANFVMTAILAHYTNQLTFQALSRSRTENQRRIQAENELRKLTRAVEQSPNTIIITDLNGTIEYANTRFLSVTGLSYDQVIGRNLQQLEAGGTPADTYREILSAMSSGREWRGECVSRKKDGSLYYETAIVSPVIDSDGITTHYLTVKQDITERKRAEEALRLSEERHRLIAHLASDVIWTMSTEGQITYVSPSVEAVRGFTADEAMQQSMAQSLTPASLAIAQRHFDQLHLDLAAGRPVQAFRGEMEYWCKDGSTVWTEVMVQPVLGENGEVIELLGVTRSIAEHKRLLQELQDAKAGMERANAELLSLATTDSLTGAWNRRHFERIAVTAIAQALRYQHPLSLVVFDIDRFKIVNDRYGHQVGDQVLIELTKVVSQVLRSTDILARWGGEEFVVVMEHCNESSAMQLAEKIRKEVESHPFPSVGTITISLGVAEFRPGDTLNAWFSQADQALYDAKNSGRNAVRCASALFA